MKGLVISPSPHIRDNSSTQRVMFHVIVALMPACIASVIIFGGRSALVISFCLITAMIFEWLTRLVMKRENTIFDLSAVVTGIILALNLPSNIPLYIAAIGTFIAIVIVKQLFGGLGQNFANPAVTARIILMLSFNASMLSSWTAPIRGATDAVSTATPLVTQSESYLSLFLGTTRGSLGETSTLALLIGCIYLIALKIIPICAPLSLIGTVAFLSLISGEDPLYQVLSGGLMIGAVFMTTDYTTTPMTKSGKIIFGIGCGIMTFAIRKWGNLPEGISFAILFMNIVTPYIDSVTRSKPIGAKKVVKKVSEV